MLVCPIRFCLGEVPIRAGSHTSSDASIGRPGSSSSTFFSETSCKFRRGQRLRRIVKHKELFDHFDDLFQEDSLKYHFSFDDTFCNSIEARILLRCIYLLKFDIVRKRKSALFCLVNELKIFLKVANNVEISGLSPKTKKAIVDDLLRRSAFAFVILDCVSIEI